jgi:hypothetical protein
MAEREIEPTASAIGKELSNHERGRNKGVFVHTEDNSVHTW